MSSKRKIKKSDFNEKLFSIAKEEINNCDEEVSVAVG